MKRRVAVITGASGGIGEALALEGARLGYDLALCARNLENLEKTATACRKIGARVLTARADVSVEADCRSFIEAAEREFGELHLLINNAGVTMRAVFNETDLDVIRKVMDINFWGTVYCTKYALPQLLKTGGTVVGISSIAGFKGLPGRTGYSASKFAVHGFLEALRVENLNTGLHVLIACPGYTASNIRKVALNASGASQGESPRDEGKMMTAEEVAKAIFGAVHRKKRYLVLTLQGKLAVFLNKISKKLTDRLVFNTIKKEPDSPFK